MLLKGHINITTYLFIEESSTIKIFMRPRLAVAAAGETAAAAAAAAGQLGTVRS